MFLLTLSMESFYKIELPYFNYPTTASGEIFKLLQNNFNIQKYKEFIKRKNEYLQKYRTLLEEEFLDLFEWAWKYNKSEIKQNNRLWLCYAYTWFEMLKKTNFFNELIKTNMRRTWIWNREVRIPFNSKWYRMKVYKQEIDKYYTFTPKKWWNEKKVCVNTDTSLGFKILEIAFLKSYFLLNSIYSRDNQIDQSIKDRKTFQETWDIEITPELLKSLEWWNAKSFLQHVLWKYVVMWNNYVIDHVDKDLAKEYFKTWCIKINLYIISWSWNIELEKLKIVDKNNKKISKAETRNITKQWNYCIFQNHCYSIEKFYEKDWESRVRVVNPWNTAEKIDISLQECKDWFDWEIIWFDIDKMFKLKKLPR